MTHVRINLGASFDYFYVGLAITGAAIYLGITTHPLFYVLVIPGIIVFIGYKVVEFDTVGRRYRVAYLLVGFRIGTWIKHSTNDKLHLYRSPYLAHLYVINFATEHGDLELNVFGEYDAAIKFMEKYADLLKLQSVDKVVLID